jgi:hypothetical protein
MAGSSSEYVGHGVDSVTGGSVGTGETMVGILVGMPGVLKPIGGVVVVASLPATTVGLGVVMTTTGRSSPSSTAGGRMTPTSTTGFNVGEVDTGDEVVIIEGVGSSGVYGGLTGVGGLGRGLALSSLELSLLEPPSLYASIPFISNMYSSISPSLSLPPPEPTPLSSTITVFKQTAFPSNQILQHVSFESNKYSPPLAKYASGGEVEEVHPLIVSDHIG